MGRGKATPLIINGTDYRRSKSCAFCKKTYFKNILVNEKNWIKSKSCSNKCRIDSMIGHKQPGKIRRKMTEEEKVLRNKKMEKLMLNHWNKGRKHTVEAKIKMSITRQNIPKEQWAGYKTSLDRMERMKFRLEVQKKVFERDNYTCQMCSSRGGALQVDHIQPWSEYVELRFDIKNCRTLCMDCHYKITFGREKPKDVLAWGHNLSRIGG